MDYTFLLVKARPQLRLFGDGELGRVIYSTLENVGHKLLTRFEFQRITIFIDNLSSTMLSFLYNIPLKIHVENIDFQQSAETKRGGQMLAAALGYIDSNEDKRRFEKLYHTYRNLMYKVAFNTLRNPQDTEDALQDAFISIAKNFSKISEIKCPRTKGFVVIVIRNISYNMLKKRNRQREMDIDIDELEIPDERPLPDETTLDKYSIEELERALQQLPSKYYDIIYLTSYLDYSIKEAADFLGISYENAKKRLSRARAKLAVILEENGYE